jgi:hypothetical protein
MEGKELRCPNRRVIHPYRYSCNSIGALVPDVLLSCNFHSQECIGFHSELRKIVTPNELSYCNECYYAAKRKRPKPMTFKTSPGVYIYEELALPKRMRRTVLNVEEVLHSGSVCRWRPTEKHLLAHRCGNTVLRDQRTKEYLPTCGFHLAQCPQIHAKYRDSFITYPNELGLCAVHYKQETGKEPERVNPPFPSMLKLRVKTFKRCKPDHWAAPPWPPSPEMYSDKLVPTLVGIEPGIKIKTFGSELMTITLQRYWRGYRGRNIHIEMLHRRMIPRRVRACILIQAKLRSCLVRRGLVKIIDGCKKEAVMIQKHIRMFLAKCRVRKYKAFQVLIRFFGFVRRSFMWESMQTVVHLRILFRQTNKPAIFIQRLFRGHRVRLDGFQRELNAFRYRRCKNIVLRCLWQIACLMRSRKLMRVEDSAYITSSVRLAHSLWRLFMKHRAKRVFEMVTEAAAPHLQRFVRGFLGRAFTNRFRQLRLAMRAWSRPVYAVKYFRMVLAGCIHIIDGALITALIKQPSIPISALALSSVISTVSGKADQIITLRSLLPERLSQLEEIDWRLFQLTLEQWYRIRNCPLLSSEASCIIHRFQNSDNGRVNILAVDEYIAIHKKPCRRHGRLICGKCAFYGGCQVATCKCPHFTAPKDGKINGVCSTCQHVGQHHRLCPSQLNPEQPATLDVILQQPRNPDLSIPVHIKGIAFISIEKSMDKVLFGKKIAELKPLDISVNKPTLPDVVADYKPKTTTYSAKRFINNAITMGTVLHDGHYWNDHHNSITGESFAEGDASDLITMSCKTPDTKVSKVKFWSAIVKKNPNKNKTEYFENFTQNIPLPIVKDNAIQYTFDGFKVYMRFVVHLSAVKPSYIHKDSPHLLRLIFDNIVVFEVHWRKLVVDVRVGKLNRRLVIDSALRDKYESRLSPNEENASRLDSVFRDLGFHKKVIGKDIVSIKFAQEKKDHLLETYHRSTNLSSVDENDSGRLCALVVMKPEMRGLVDEAEESSVISPIRLEGGKYVCPYPACGKTSNSHISTWAHMCEHEKSKLSVVSVSNPKTDAYFENFWPADSTWVPRDKDIGKKKLMPSDAIFCPLSGCRDYFIDQRQLSVHLKLKHPGFDANLAYSSDYFMLSEYVEAPSFESLGLHICKQHKERPSKHCRVCQEIEGRNCPKPPYKFYNLLSVNFPSNEDNEIASGERYVQYSRFEQQKAMEFINKKGKIVHTWRGFVRELVLDRNKKCWLCVEELVNYEDACSRKMQIPRDMEKVLELLPCPSSSPALWVTLDQALQDVSILHMTKFEFTSLQKKKKVTMSNTYFIRPENERLYS